MATNLATTEDHLRNLSVVVSLTLGSVALNNITDFAKSCTQDFKATTSSIAATVSVSICGQEEEETTVMLTLIIHPDDAQ